MRETAILVPPVPSTIRRCGAYSTALEPSTLVDAFMQHPPAGFACRWVAAGSHAIPTFDCAYDLRTTLDGDGPWLRRLRQSRWLRWLTTLRAMFAGSTVSEYALLPSLDSFDQYLDAILSARRRSQLVIIKDIPADSPLIPGHANQHAQLLVEQARAKGFLIVEGQALAYVPIDFASIEEYLSRLSKTRRKDFRRKLNSRADVTIEQLETGSPEFNNAQFVWRLFKLYLNVYEQSEYHFDKLSFEFFLTVLMRRDSGGIVFIYRQGVNVIGFNLCFIHNSMLVDKYVGFRYPEARDCNLYFVSWFTNLEFALRHKLTHYVAGWTDPEVKRSLGAKFTFTKHAVYVWNPVLRAVLNPLRKFFEPDANWAKKEETP